MNAAPSSPATERTTGIEVAIERLRELMQDDEYDRDFLRPTAEAHDFALSLLTGALSLISRDVPNASPAPIGDGGLFMQWGGQDRYVRLLVSPAPSGSYLYCKAPGEKYTVRALDAGVLAHWLEWLTAG